MERLHDTDNHDRSRHERRRMRAGRRPTMAKTVCRHLPHGEQWLLFGLVAAILAVALAGAARGVIL